MIKCLNRILSFLFLSLQITFLLAILTANSAYAAQGSVRVASRAPFSGSFDPIKNLATQELYLKPIYETLVTLGQDGSIQPLLATAWKRDGMTYRFTLRQNVKFHDGTPFDASAVVAHFQRGKSTPGPNSVLFANIKSVVALNASEVDIILIRPFPSFLVQLTSMPGMIASPTAASRPDLAQRPVGTGPWLLDDAATRRGSVVVFKAFEKYWDSKAQGVSRIDVYQYASEAARLNSIKGGSLDAAEIQGDQVDEVKAAGMAVSEDAANRWVAFGIFDMEGKLVPAFADLRVRQAMMYAIDRKAIAEKLYFGYAEPSVQPFPKGHWAHEPSLDAQFAYDPQKARKLLAEAGYAAGFEFTVPSTPLFKEANEAMSGYLAAIGVKMNVEMVAGDLQMAALSKKYPGWLVSFPAIDPDDYPAKNLNQDGSTNVFGWKDPELVALSAETFAAPFDDIAKRTPAYRAWVKYVVQRGYFVGLVTPQQLRATSKRVTKLIWPRGAPYFQYRELQIKH